MKRSNNLLVTLLTFLIFAFFNINAFAQEQPEHQELDLSELENSEQTDDRINKDLQTNFIIVEPARGHVLNPHITAYSSDSQILTGLYEGLFSYNPLTLEPQYAIASDYKISRDKKRMTFTIRSNAKFSNGEKITAESVRASWLKLLATEQAPYASLLDIIRGAADFRKGLCTISEVGIYALDENTLAVYLTTPANYLPKVLCHSAFSVIHNDTNVFSGPFVLAEQTETAYVLKKNPEYWDNSNTHLEQITFVQSADMDQNTYMYNTGAADWVVTDINVQKLLNSSAIQMQAEFGTAYYFFKTSAAKPCDEYGVKKLSVWDYPEFRNAIMEIIPWDVLRSNALVPATTYVYPLAGYPTVEGFNYTDKLEAKIKMKDARKKYDILEEQILPLTFELTEYVLSEEKLNLLKESFAELNVELIVNIIDANQYLSGVKTSTSDLFAYTWIGDFADPLAFLELFHSTSTLNDSGWKSSTYDELLEKAAVVSDLERYKLLAEAETILLDEAMIIPLYHPVSFNVINLSEVGGWANNAFDIHPLKYIYKKTPVTKKSDNVVNFEY